MTLQSKYITDLTSSERVFIDNKYNLKIYSSNGQSFEDFFANVMFASDNRFVKVKAWGNIGDRKNDGCIPCEGLYYQVFAPEDINLNTAQYKALSKLREDSEGLTSHWNEHMPQGVKTFKYVVNDKFSGTHPDLITELELIKTDYALNEADLFTSSHLRLSFQLLPVHEIERVLDMIVPNECEFRTINIRYEPLNEILDYIAQKDVRNITPRLVAPDWEDKISFNELGEVSVRALKQGEMTISAVDEYLSSKEFSADTLQRLMTEIYLEVKADFENIPNSTTDDVFWETINRCIPVKKTTYQAQMFPIMAKYFETCDIFEEPVNNQ